MFLSRFLRHGFTLIELLIVIAIIGILTTLIFSNLQGARERARDARRKSDLHSIQQALRLYYQDQQAFPTSTSSFAIQNAPWGGPFRNSTGTVTYASQLPLDPTSTASHAINYNYYSTGENYILVSSLENLSDSAIAASQARCPTTYPAYLTASGNSGATSRHYVVCEE